MRLRRMRLSHGRGRSCCLSARLLLPVCQLLTGEKFSHSLLRLGRLFPGLRNDSPNVPGGYFLASLYMRLCRMRLSHGRGQSCHLVAWLLLPVCQLLTGENFPQSLLRLACLFPGLRNHSSDVPGGYFLARLYMRLRRMRLGHGRGRSCCLSARLLLPVCQLLTGKKIGSVLLRPAFLVVRVRNDRSNVFGCDRPRFFSWWLLRQRFGRSLPLRLHLWKQRLHSPHRTFHGTAYLALLLQRRRFQCM